MIRDVFAVDEREYSSFEMLDKSPNEQITTLEKHPDMQSMPY